MTELGWGASPTHPRTAAHIAAVRAFFGNLPVTDEEIANVVWRVSDSQKAIANVQKILNAKGVKAAMVNVTTDASFEPVSIAAPKVVEELEKLKVCELWVDDALVGCGFRRFIVLEEGDRTVRLFSAAKLAAIKVDRRYFEQKAKFDRRPNRRAIADIIRRNVAMADRINDREQAPIVSDGGKDACTALQLLTQ
jgi:hypothetical protein